MALRFGGMDDLRGESGDRFPSTASENVILLEWLGLCIRSHLPSNVGFEIILSGSKVGLPCNELVLSGWSRGALAIGSGPLFV